MKGAARLSRRNFLETSAAAVALSRPGAPAQAQSRRPYTLIPREVAAGLWMITGATESFGRQNGGAIVNIALLQTTAGAVVVDTGSTAAMGAAIRAFAQDRMGGVAMVLNTHNHPDHWLGNAAFADCPVQSLPDTAALCSRNARAYTESLYAILGLWMSGTVAHPPQGVVAPGTLRIGGRALRMLPLDGHTPADLVILDEETGTLIAGDLLFLDRAPSFPDADAGRWLAALETIEGISASGVVPGHGGFHRSNAALVQTRAYVRATRDRMRQAADLGLSAPEAMAAGPVPAHAAMGANPEEYIRTIAQRWRDTEIEALPVIGGL